MRHRLPMIAANVEALPTVGDGADEDGFPRAIVILRVGLRRFALPFALNGNEVERGGSKIRDAAAFLMGHIAGHRQGLEIDLWSHDGGAHAKEHSAFESIDRVTDCQKIAVAGGAEGSRIEIGVLVENVVTDTDVSRDRDVQVGLPQRSTL